MDSVHQCGEKLSAMGDVLENKLVGIDDFVQKVVARVQEKVPPKAVIPVMVVAMVLLVNTFLTMGVLKFCLVLLMGAMGNEKFYQRNPAFKIQHILIVFNIWVTLAILF